MASKLEIKKIYIDTRFKTSNSKSDTDFSIELPRQFNVPEDTVAYIDDIVIPVSWYAVNENNRWLYFGAELTGTHIAWQTGLAIGNYTGASLAADLQTKLNTASTGYEFTFTVAYDNLHNRLSISVTDNRDAPPTPLIVSIFDEKDLLDGQWSDTPVAVTSDANRIIGLRATAHILVGQPFYGAVDLHTTRNLYLTSSALASYDTVSNFGIDTIIKKIPASAGYNEILFDNASEGFDYLNVSARSLRTIDFKLVDSYFHTMDLQGMHWSFSIVFQTKG